MAKSLAWFAIPSAASTCPIQQQAQYWPAGTSNAVCAELVITAANGKLSIDTVTVTIGGKVPTHVAAIASVQAAIDAANPGDLITIDPTGKPTCTAVTGAPAACNTAGAIVHTNAAAHSELLLMWKPVRLQGVGGASSIIDGNTHPAGKLDTWRARVNCLFGLGLSGVHGDWSPSCGAGLTAFKATANNPQVDRIPLEPIVGWDANFNGNLAQLLQEPSLMGALEGAAIAVLSKGVNFPSNPFLADTFPTGSTLLTGSVSTGTYSTGDNNSRCATSATNKANPFRVTSSATRRASTAWGFGTVLKAAAVSSFTPGVTTCRSPTTTSPTTPELSLAASTSARANSPNRTSAARRQ